MTPVTKLNFCTLFDSYYLTRGLALYHSLRTHCDRFTLYVYCFDDSVYEILTRLELPHLVPVSLREFENEALLSVKPDRTRGEYCWTCTAHTIRDAIKRFTLPDVTYLDSDLYFFADPGLLMVEFKESGASVLITEHRYSPRYALNADSGIYCVQFMPFVADKRGMAVLDWWCERTLEWCFNRHEDGKFGDQKYLDDWTARFPGVHVLKHPGGGVAPWNIQQYKVGPGPTIDSAPLVFYHFHSLSWCEDNTFMLDRYRLTRIALDTIYHPYIASLKEQLTEIQRHYPNFKRGTVPLPTRKKPFWQSLEHKIKGKFHVIR